MAFEPDDHTSPAFQEWAERLRVYVDGQGELAGSTRRKVMPNDPWPEEDNPMVAYMAARAGEIEESDGLEAAVIWLVVHAWREGAIEVAAKFTRMLS